MVLQLLPIVMEQTHFALKGGTAINFFLRNLNRLSRDIDLSYVHIEDRDKSIRRISESLKTIASSIESKLVNVKITPKTAKNSNLWKGLIIERNGVFAKIEPNPVIRGTVFPCEFMELSPDAQDLFEMFVIVKTLSLPDLYGGKICAALDRQHPRDLFDIKLLVENEGLTDEIRKAFLVYLISHNRPIHELLDPGLLDMKNVFEVEFSGLTRETVSYEELVQVRGQLIEGIRNGLTNDEKEFLLSFKRLEPEWELLGIQGVQELPAVRWKLQNLGR